MIYLFISFILDDDGVIMKSTRHAGDNFNNNLVNVLSATPSTILVHGLLGEVCIGDSDCSIFNSHCEPTFKRCACKPKTIAADHGKICKFADQRAIPPTVLISKSYLLTSPFFYFHIRTESFLYMQYFVIQNCAESHWVILIVAAV